MSMTAGRDDNLVYTEQISSTKTEALFVALTALFALLSVRRAKARLRDILSAVFRCFFAVFLFYSVNYRTLIIRLTPEALTLKFGIFTWVVPLAWGCAIPTAIRTLRGLVRPKRDVGLAFPRQPCYTILTPTFGRPLGCLAGGRMHSMPFHQPGAAGSAPERRRVPAVRPCAAALSLHERR